jgi:hypothetical protein
MLHKTTYFQEYCLLGYNSVKFVEGQITFRKNISPPSSGSNKPSNKPACKQVASRSFMLISSSGYFLTPKMEAACSSETSLNIQRTTRRCIPKDSTLHTHRCENLKSYNIFSSCPKKMLPVVFAFIHYLDYVNSSNQCGSRKNC